MGRVAIITGGSRGIGLATARHLQEEGYRVAIVARNHDSLMAALDSFEVADNVEGFLCDVSNTSQISSMYQEVYERFGQIDVVINNAGILDKTTIESLSEEVWDEVLDTNLKGTFFMIQQAITYLQKADHPRIINIASNAGRMGGYENGLAYTASKGGIIALTYGAARRLAPLGITVNCVAPGTIESDMSKEYDSEALARLLERFPLGRLGKSYEVAGAIAYFASEISDFVTGAVLDVNGGMFMG